MKIALILVIVMAILSVGGVLIWHYSEIDKADLQIQALQEQTKNLGEQVKLLNEQLAQEKINNTELSRQAYPEAFTTPREMVKWLGDHKIVSGSKYFSEDAMSLLNEAREAGVWMGVIPVSFNFSNKTSPIEIPIAGISSSPYLFCVTILKDGSIYLVDPTGEMDAVKLMVMGAEFKWNKVSIESKGVH
jgi:hypothetical protein